MKTGCFLLALTLLMSCQRNPDTPTAEENSQLNDVSNLLNQAPARLDGVDDQGLNADTQPTDENRL